MLGVDRESRGPLQGVLGVTWDALCLRDHIPAARPCEAAVSSALPGGDDS